MTFDEWWAAEGEHKGKCKTESKIWAREAWNNRQALIDAHNRRKDDECKQNPTYSECSPDSARCDRCPRRHRIED